MSVEFEESGPFWDDHVCEGCQACDVVDDSGWDDADLPDPPAHYLFESELPAAPAPPRATDPLSLRLLSVLAQKSPAQTSTYGLVDDLCGWQRFTGFATSKIWVQIAELHARFTTGARTRLDQAAATGDETAGEQAADAFDLAERSLTAEIATALSWSTTRAGDQLDIALILTGDLAATLEAVTHGRLEVKKAEAIARALHREEPALRALVETMVLDEAAGWTLPELRDQIRTAILRVAPDLAARRAEHAYRMRGVSFKPEPDDMIRLEACLPVLDGIRVQAALDTTALDIHATHTPTGPDQRGLDQIRADVLADTLIALTEPHPTEPHPTDQTAPGQTATDQSATGESGGEATHSETAHTETTPGKTTAHTETSDPHDPHDGDSHGQARDTAHDAGARDADPTGRSKEGQEKERARRVKRGLRREVVITVPLETITGDADHPGHLSRYGPISAHTARALAQDVARDGYWRCAVTDDVHGTLLGLGRSTYTPAYKAPEYLKRFVNLRDQVCSFPGCRTPATLCDYDHTIPYPTGRTCECGGGNRCGNHHRLKHESAWSVKRCEDPDHPPGTHIWTSPTGRDYISTPPAIGIPNATTTPRTRNITNVFLRRLLLATAQNTNPQNTAAQDAHPWTYDPTLPELPTATPPPVTAAADNPPPF